MSSVNNKKDIETEDQNFIEKILQHKALILILFGFLLRFIMLFYYYFIHAVQPGRSWGDVGINFKGDCCYPPLSLFLMYFFRAISFGSVEIFAFWAFFLEFLTAIMFYFVLKHFKVPHLKYAYGLYLVNPFFFLNNIFSATNCGYHITDSYFFLFLFTALFFYNNKTFQGKLIFYIFLSLSAAAKIYTLPFIAFFFLKFLFEKDWEEMKTFVLGVAPVILAFLVTPLFFMERYIQTYLTFNSLGETTLPIYVRAIPPLLIFATFMIFRFRKADLLEMAFVSVLITGSFLFFSLPFIRYFQPFLIYPILTPKEHFSFEMNFGFMKRKIKFDNNLLVFYTSFGLVLLAYIIIIFLL